MKRPKRAIESQAAGMLGMLGVGRQQDRRGGEIILKTRRTDERHPLLRYTCSLSLRPPEAA